jgi:kynurenine formamidase
LNRVTPAATLRGLGAVTSGNVLSLALPIREGKGPMFGARAPLQHFMTRDGGDYAAGLPERGFGYADDSIVMATHGTTHIDALAHVWKDRLMWNGFSADHVTSGGARRCGIETVGPIVTRGVFLDCVDGKTLGLPDDAAIGPDDLEQRLSRLGVEPQEGDALLVRTGWLNRWRAGDATTSRWPGLAPECAEWVDSYGFALVAADNIAVELGPSPDPADAAPLHAALMRDRGVFFMELLDLESLVDLDRPTFLFVVSPLRIEGGVGSPVSPVAVI